MLVGVSCTAVSQDVENLLSRAELIVERVLDWPPRSRRLDLVATLQKRSPGKDAAALIAELQQDLHALGSGDASTSLLRAMLRPYRQKLRLKGDSGQFMPEDFVDLFADVAEEAGFDLRKFGSALHPGTSHPEFEVGMAVRTMFESTGIYTEVPGACTFSTVQRKAIIIASAALLGILTGESAKIDPVFLGAFGGIAGLILNVLATRYDQKSLHPETNWLEEVILRILEERGNTSFEMLREASNVHPDLLRRVLTQLEHKGLVEQQRSWTDKTNIRYRLTGQHDSSHLPPNSR